MHQIRSVYLMLWEMAELLSKPNIVQIRSSKSPPPHIPYHQVLHSSSFSSSAISGIVEPPHIRNWFPDYEYQSPELDIGDLPFSCAKHVLVRCEGRGMTAVEDGDEAVQEEGNEAAFASLQVHEHGFDGHSPANEVLQYLDSGSLLSGDTQRCSIEVGEQERGNHAGYALTTSKGTMAFPGLNKCKKGCGGVRIQNADGSLSKDPEAGFQENRELYSLANSASFLATKSNVRGAPLAGGGVDDLKPDERGCKQGKESQAGDKERDIPFRHHEHSVSQLRFGMKLPGIKQPTNEYEEFRFKTHTISGNFDSDWKSPNRRLREGCYQISKRETVGQMASRNDLASMKNSSYSRTNNENHIEHKTLKSEDEAKVHQAAEAVYRNDTGVKRKVLNELTNLQGHDVIVVAAGKWRCPRKSKPNLGPPLKQLRLEQWVHKV